MFTRRNLSFHLFSSKNTTFASNNQLFLRFNSVEYLNERTRCATFKSNRLQCELFTRSIRSYPTFTEISQLDQYVISSNRCITLLLPEFLPVDSEKKTGASCMELLIRSSSFDSSWERACSSVQLAIYLFFSQEYDISSDPTIDICDMWHYLQGKSCNSLNTYIIS